MPDSKSTKPERGGQAWFTLRTFLGCVLLALAINEATWRFILPSKRPSLGTRGGTLEVRPISTGESVSNRFRVAGTWELSSPDSRFGGISALAVDGDSLLALTDFGAAVRFPKPGPAKAVATISDVARGPRTTWMKANWDIEAMAADPAGRGWWVAFERAGEVWLYDRTFSQGLERFRVRSLARSGNAGAEGMAFDGQSLLLFAESGGKVVRVTGGRATTERIRRATSRISDAAGIGPGLVMAIERHLTLFGFRNRLVVFEAVGGEFVRRLAWPIPAGPLDNLEGLAVERLGGRTRLWLISDDGFQKPFRTVLMAIDLDPAGAAGEAS